MITRAKLNFRTIRCLQPSESEDEPYLWTYFWKVDDDTVSQLTQASANLHGSVSVHTRPGSHGNLPTFEKDGVGLIHPDAAFIDPELGQFSADLRPIRVHLNGKTYLIPGQIWCFMALLEEDETTNQAVEAAHQEMRQHIEQSMNAAIGNINVAAVRNAAAARAPTTPVEWSRHLADAFMESLDPVANGFGETLRTKVNDEASADEDWWNPASWDWDECIGTFIFRMDEIRLREQMPAGNVPVEFIEFNSEGQWDSIYRLDGSVEVQPIESDIQLLPAGSASTSHRVDEGTATTEGDIICLPMGTLVHWDLIEDTETEEFLLFAPYGPVVWFVEALPLPPPGGTVSPTCMHSVPKFNLAAPGWVTYTKSTGPVQISYTFIPDEQAVRVRFANNPQDGSYSVSLYIRQTPNPADAVLATTSLGFGGLSISIPAHDAFEDCLREKFGQARYKKPSVRDLWGPAQRLKIYERLILEGQRRVEAGLLSSARFRAVDVALQKRLGLSLAGRQPALIPHQLRRGRSRAVKKGAFPVS